jgi:hypothetical protein
MLKTLMIVLNKSLILLIQDIKMIAREKWYDFMKKPRKQENNSLK